MKVGGAIFALCLLATGLDVPAQDITTIEPHGATQGEACIALAVFSQARVASWFEQALVARSVINAASLDGDVCTVAGSLPAVSRWKLPRRPDVIDPIAWRQAQAVARAVGTGDYYIPPPCDQVIGIVGADRFIPDGTVPLCVVGASIFLVPADTAPAQTAALLAQGRQ